MRTWMYVALITWGWMFIEWILFELRRLPYRPPHDMTTFLGYDRDGVFGFMAAAFLLWIFIVVPLCLSANFTRKDYFFFGLYLSMLASIVGYLIRFPSWPVTPWHLYWS